MNISYIEDEKSRIGAWPDDGGGVRFRVWAPTVDKVELALVKGETKTFHPMEKVDRGYHQVRLMEAQVGSRYFYRLNSQTMIPDPASRYQPEGVHGPSEVITPEYSWTDDKWQGIDLSQLVIYELHVGTFTKAGNFDGVREKLKHLKSIGVNAVEIMPVAQFAGKRNWGYDGVGLFATQNSYGSSSEISPLALKHLVNECHENGIAVILDVVYNHLGPEGNYLSQFGPYFQSKYHTPWGDALNYDGEWSDEVRKYFLENARQWLDEFHFDGLRLDAVHAIFDTSAKPFLEDLSDLKKRLEHKRGRKMHLIAESDANDSRVLQDPEVGGLGMDAHWADDLHHCIHALVTGEKHGYYADYGDINQLVSAYQDGVVFNGEYSEFRHRSHGRSYDGIDRNRLVVCSQNHDQIGNRMNGERMVSLVGPEKMKLAAACAFLSPCLPLMYMGEEIADDSPFLYFIDHTDKNLVEAVRKGRKEEFSSFKWQGEPPDPASPETFERSRIKWERLEEQSSQSGTSQSKDFMNYYTRLIELSKWIRRERLLEAGNVTACVIGDGKILEVNGRSGQNRIQVFLSFSSASQQANPSLEGGPLEIALNSLENGTYSVNDMQKANHQGAALKPGPLEIGPFSAIVLRSTHG